MSFNSTLIKYKLFVHLCDKRCLIKRIVNDTSVSSSACCTSSSFPSGLVGKSPTNFRSDMCISVITYLLSHWKLLSLYYVFFSLILDCDSRTRGKQHTLAFLFNPYRRRDVHLWLKRPPPTDTQVVFSAPPRSRCLPWYNLYKCQIESIAMSSAARTLGMTVIINT